MFNVEVDIVYVTCLLPQNPEQVAWGYFEIQDVEISEGKKLSQGQI